MSEEHHHVDHSKNLTHLSLCTGYGGIDLGLKRALGDIRTVAYVEIEAFACENLVTKIEAELLDAAPIWTNLKTFPWESFRGRVDILSGGFPCQPFSKAGKRAGDSDPRHLWPHITNGIRRLGNPPIIFMENVEGIISSKLTGSEWSDPEGTPVLLHVLRELERMGYKAEASVFSAAEVGAPHQRRRVFILAHSRRYGERSQGTALHSKRGALEWVRARLSEEWTAQNIDPKDAGDLWPSFRGEQQYKWEPPRVKPKVGRGANGASFGMGDEILLNTADSQTDELRLLGNGVVPATAERAFRVLWDRL